jgi:EAL domain-containing protein (putative c-di-GMP-specific phosphodiesterase class I)
MFGYENNIVIEITEEVLSSEKEGALSAFLERAKDLGLKIALDDFASDHSNFNRLLHYDIDIIKLDKSFVQKIGDFQKANLMIKHLKKMSEDLNIEIYAEGVSSKAISDLLLDMGISIHQGFLYSKPVSLSQFLDTPDAVWKGVVDR